MYQESGVMPSPSMAGLMVAAILSDTVMFKSLSPAGKKRDIAMAETSRQNPGAFSWKSEDSFLFNGSDKSAEQLIKETISRNSISPSSVSESVR